MTASPSQKVLITTPVLLVGGTEIQTLHLIKTLLSAGYEVKVCCYFEYHQFMLSQANEAGAEVILMEASRSDGILKLMGKLRKIFLLERPDIVHIQYMAPGLIPIIAARLAGVKRVFATVHQPGRVYGWKAKILIRIAACLSNAFFCNSRAVEESWFGSSEIFDPARNSGGRKHFTIYNGVDTERIERIVQDADKERIKDSLNVNGKKIIGVVGRLRKEKGQIHILEAMRLIVKEIPDVVLLVVGDGPDRQYLQRVAKKFGIEDHVKWLGQKEHDEVLKLYSIMDFVVVPSLFEGFGLTAAEAMAAGKPVVASNVDGLTELVENEVTGLLVPLGDQKALSETITELVSDPPRAALMGARGQESIQKNFSLERVQSSILAAYSRFSQA